ncbi:hypothetical protein GGTG_13622 [Gaeumannomyces tritici R3-111a-1]|uniref:Uncharacterized protein n=1 Tax=Gaeumannomyces tritici (strain R3-111a-1) TaxID=644352 RepID=J3PJE2_GAET3|nr:hypothetical protein GGTG_13622 [Gaeumannomyces tritici R3-111a-1]EJT68808.1 hypothetical protein GGTG_13622 [Gaeumannomyces tritici R3-111a-1]
MAWLGGKGLVWLYVWMDGMYVCMYVCMADRLPDGEKTGMSLAPLMGCEANRKLRIQHSPHDACLSMSPTPSVPPGNLMAKCREQVEGGCLSHPPPLKQEPRKGEREESERERSQAQAHFQISSARHAMPRRGSTPCTPPSLSSV